MNVSHLTKPELCKALSDASEYNKSKADALVDKFKSCAEMPTNVYTAYSNHLHHQTKFAQECRRLQCGGR